jgi:ATP-binding cassette subfamily B multidrug efflux pump
MLGNKFEINFFKMSFDHFKLHLGKYFIAIISLVLLHVIQVQVPLLIIQLTNQVEDINYKNLIIQFVLVALGIIFFRTISRWFFFYPARVQQKDLRNQFLNLLSLSLPFNWKHYSTGKLYEILVSDLEEIRVFFGFALLQIINLIIAMIILFPAMSNVSADLMWSLLPLGFFFLVFSLSLVFTTKLSEQGRHEHDILQQMLVEFYDAKKTLNVFCKEKSAVAEFAEQSKKELDIFLKVNIIRSITRPLILLGGGLSLVFAAYLVFTRNYPLTYLVVYSTFIFLLYEPLGYLSWIGIIITETKVSWNRMISLIGDLESGKKFDSNIGVNNHSTLSFNLVNQNLNQNINLQIGGHYLLIGATASGKTTFLETLHYAALNQKMSSILVPQDPYLFNQNIEENLFLHIPMNKDLKLKALHLLKVFDLQDIASSDEELLSLAVGEKGKKLSGGQVKRLHMIRSLLFDYDLIIWDDPFSALDVITEKKILTEILIHNPTYLEGKMLLLTTHRMSTVKYFNSLIYCTRQEIQLGPMSDSHLKNKVDEFFKVHGE